jgi:hypothetical protein
MPAWADDNGHDLFFSGTEDGALVFYVRKGADL